MAGSTVTESATAEPSSGRRVMRIALVAVLAVAAIVGSWYWLTHPSSLEGSGADLELSSSIGHTLAIDTTVSSAGEGETARVTLKDLTPRIVQNTADASVVLVVCHRNAGSNALGTGEVAELSKYCTRVDPLRRMPDARLGFSTNQIVALVTARKAGVLHIAGFDAGYRVGLRRGRQHVGADIRLTAAR